MYEIELLHIIVVNRNVVTAVDCLCRKWFDRLTAATLELVYCRRGTPALRVVHTLYTYRQL